MKLSRAQKKEETEKAAAEMIEVLQDWEEWNIAGISAGCRGRIQRKGTDRFCKYCGL